MRKTTFPTDVVKRELERNPDVTVRLFQESNPGVFGEVLVRMVSRCIHELEYNSYHPLKKLMLSHA